MSRRISSRAGVTLVVALASLLVGAMAAWACTNLATLNLSQSAVQAGSQIDVTGSSFATQAKGGQAVEVVWNAVDGPVLATAMPDPTGNIATSITVPADAQPGYYVVVARQSSQAKDGKIEPAYGTPARAALLVGSVAPADLAQPAAAPAVVAAESTSTGMILLTALLALLGIGLFGAGLGLFVREARRRAVPAPIRRPDERP